ncbi:MAG: YgaP family membrane protein [Formosimonas sp.]
MDTNLGRVDRMLRIGSGCFFLALLIVRVIGAWGWLGLMLVASGVVGICPLYAVLGKSTRPKRRRTIANIKPVVYPTCLSK